MGLGRLHDPRSRALPAAARMLALVYDWWNIFVRLADPNLHREAVASRPLFLSAIATRTRHARQTTIRITSSHAKAKPAAGALAAVASFLRGLAQNAEQFGPPAKMAHHPLPRLPRLPQWPPDPPPATPRPDLMQPQGENPHLGAANFKADCRF